LDISVSIVESRGYEESEKEAGGSAQSTGSEAGGFEFVGASVGIEVAYDEDWGLLPSGEEADHGAD
jgi:hypothetical protein